MDKVKKPAGIKDVARALGISIATVDRAFHDRWVQRHVCHGQREQWNREFNRLDVYTGGGIRLRQFGQEIIEALGQVARLVEGATDGDGFLLVGESLGYPAAGATG